MQPLLDGDTPLTAEEFGPHRVEERLRAEESLATWNAETPQLRTSWADLDQTWQHSVADIAALRMQVAGFDYGRLPAAGTPWFMTVFGRDTLITCLQSMIFGPELSRAALRVLAALQSDDGRRRA